MTELKWIKSQRAGSGLWSPRAAQADLPSPPSFCCLLSAQKERLQLSNLSCSSCCLGIRASHFKQILSNFIWAIPFHASNESCSLTPAIRAAMWKGDSCPSPPASLLQDRDFHSVVSPQGPQGWCEWCLEKKQPVFSQGRAFQKPQDQICGHWKSPFMSVEESPPAPWGLSMHKGEGSHIPSFLNCCSWFPTINNEWNLWVRNYHSAWKAKSTFNGCCLSTVNVFQPSSWLWAKRSQKWLMSYYLLAPVAQDLGVAGKQNHLEQKAGKSEATQGYGSSLQQTISNHRRRTMCSA